MLSGHLRYTRRRTGRSAHAILIFRRETIRAYMEKFFSVERMTQDYINLYTEILQNGVTEAEQIVA